MVFTGKDSGDFPAGGNVFVYGRVVFLVCVFGLRHKGCFQQDIFCTKILGTKDSGKTEGIGRFELRILEVKT